MKRVREQKGKRARGQEGENVREYKRKETSG